VPGHDDALSSGDGHLHALRQDQGKRPEPPRRPTLNPAVAWSKVSPAASLSAPSPTARRHHRARPKPEIPIDPRRAHAGSCLGGFRTPHGIRNLHQRSHSAAGRRSSEADVEATGQHRSRGWRADGQQNAPPREGSAFAGRRLKGHLVLSDCLPPYSLMISQHARRAVPRHPTTGERFRLWPEAQPGNPPGERTTPVRALGPCQSRTIGRRDRTGSPRPVRRARSGRSRRWRL